MHVKRWFVLCLRHLIIESWQWLRLSIKGKMNQKSKRKKGNVYETLDVRGVDVVMTFAVVGVIIASGGGK